ncbi:MAG: hypothetical protein ACO3NK_00765 [Prochlorotrichaceae cyanobacterium]
MSETTAFLAGSAVAGVAALLMLKSGGLSLSQAEVLQPYAQTPSTLVTPAPIVGPPLPDNGNPELEALLRNQLDTNKGATDELKLQLEQQRDTTAQLKAQLEDQRREATGVIDRLRDQQRSMDMLTLQQALPREEDPSLLEQAQALQTIQNRDSAGSAQVVTLWALGGILLILILGGGVILVSVIVILIQQQRKPNKAGPVVHHPITMPMSYNQLPYGTNPSRRSPLILPPYVRRGPSSSTPPYPPYNPYQNNPYHNPHPGNQPNPYRDNTFRDNIFRDWEA